MVQSCHDRSGYRICTRRFETSADIDGDPVARSPGRRGSPSQLNGGQKRSQGCREQRLRLPTLRRSYPYTILDLDGTRVATHPTTITTTDSRTDHPLQQSHTPQD